MTSALLLPLLLHACESQYIAIPGAVRLEEDYDRPVTSEQQPVVTIIEGDQNLEVGETVIINVDISVITDITVEQLRLWTLRDATTVYTEWTVDVTDEEREAGSVELEVTALSSKPTEEWCQRDYRGVGVCYGESSEGTISLSAQASDANSSTLGGSTPLVLALLRDVASDECEPYSFEWCCTDYTGIDVLGCEVPPSCGCPSPASTGRTFGNGNTECICPA